MTTDSVYANARDQYSLTRGDVDTILQRVQTDNPTLLVGGFAIDSVIIAIYATLQGETDEGGTPLLQDDEIYSRITNVLGTMYAEIAF